MEGFIYGFKIDIRAYAIIVDDVLYKVYIKPIDVLSKKKSGICHKCGNPCREMTIELAETTIFKADTMKKVMENSQLFNTILEEAKKLSLLHVEPKDNLCAKCLISA